jgi:hypothetical protein
MNGQDQAGPSQFTQNTAGSGIEASNGSLTQRQREKSRAISSDDIVIDDDHIDRVRITLPVRKTS